MVECVKLAVEVARIDDYGDDEHIARAAIAAMREPTEAMLNAAKTYQSAAALGCAWRAMIDQILSEK